MPRKFLLATTAAAALLGAASLGAAQDTRQGSPGGANSMHSQTQGVQENRGQGGAAAQENRGRGEQRGEANTEKQSGQKSDREMGAGNRSAEHNEQMGTGNREEKQRNNQRSEEKMQRPDNRRSEENMQRRDRRSEDNMQRRDQRSEENMQRRDQRGETTGERNREHSGVKHEGTGPGRAQSNEGINRNGADRMQNNEGMGQRSEQGNSRFESARSVRLSNQQRTKIRDTFTHEHVQRVDHPDFALKVGTPVPRDVQVYDVPEDIVVVVPQYRGLKYIIVRNEVVFLDPETLEIVAIMPA